MIFHSILFESPVDAGDQEIRVAPTCFADLLLDQIIDAVTAGKQEYDLAPFFYTPLTEIGAIQYRQEIMRDLEDELVLGRIKTFAARMVEVRRCLKLAADLTFPNHKQGWFLEAASAYCEAVTDLAQGLSTATLRSRGCLSFGEWLGAYSHSAGFQQLLRETQELKSDLSGIRYSVIIKGLTVMVRKYESEADYSTEVEKTFEKFKQGAVKDYRSKLFGRSSMGHVEAQILDFVAKLFPEIFSRLEKFCAEHSTFVNETLRVFDREVQFYVAYLDYVADLRRAGLKFCYPEVTDHDKEIHDYDGYDLALAHQRVSEDATVVTNDFQLKGSERIFVVSGPNQGGKTTFARTFGQLHYLARLGCPVPGSDARLFLYDQLFTHFEKQEEIENLRGKLEDDLIRIHEILEQATPRSILILNEIFTSTTIDDAVVLGRKILEKILRLDSLSVFVTFIDELTSLSEKTVSVVSTVVPENPAQRTFKIVRKPADGLAYALSIAEKHRLTYEHVLERVKP
jgi:hypothetical protein